MIPSVSELYHIPGVADIAASASVVCKGIVAHGDLLIAESRLLHKTVEKSRICLTDALAVLYHINGIIDIFNAVCKLIGCIAEV